MLNRRYSDKILQGITYLASFTSLFVLLSIVMFVILNGVKLINIDLITNNYESKSYIADLKDFSSPGDFTIDKTFGEDTFYSSKWGIALKDDQNLMGHNVIKVSYVHPDSPFKELRNKGVSVLELSLSKNYEIVRIAFEDAPSALAVQGAFNMISILDTKDTFREIEYSTTGGGIRGSIVTTLYLIGLTLLIALPIGIGAALYLNEYAPKNGLTKTLRNLIETLTGVPSIIYGLMGLALFVPITIQLTKATGPNLISGALTLSVILLPVIIRTTEESLKVVPDEYRQAALALGSNKTQTTFKVVLPSAFSGILTATLLAIGRIIGESAALVFAVGTAIKDQVSIFDKSTSLSVHIFAMMTDEPANIELSTTISIIILVIVLSMNLTIKFLSKRLLRKVGITNE
ncbi:phosphate ABC transporter permease PstA [Acholeplasma vituli]|uniref:Phosphate transport system permease protein PstA n=1 Tax=Paracholeplasma vituli TaxID=69473 RepID=A0ABT2PYL1_9MOLU|nr:phosphate ABC transporter permease PstA [Paracholeplasma vituli]MCU0104753.1 phosphate ABC transporter permease PstA [Paracholeplasma vituli]